MSQLSPDLDPRARAEALLAIEREEALETALAGTPVGVAARAVAAAPSLERKTTLLWAMEDRQRRRVLDLIPPPVVGALIQNLEEDNVYLLGDLSLEQFHALLSLCSPERKYYWISAALSFTDVRANALPLLLPTGDLVEILMTRAEFEEHLHALANYPIEDQRIPPDMMRDPAQALVDFMGADNLLRQFPIAEPTLERIIQTILDYDPDRYVDIIRDGLRRSDYAENHPLEWDTLTEDPVLLDSLPPIEVLPDDLPAVAEEPAPDDGLPIALVPVTAPPLVRLVGALSPAQRGRISEEMQHLYIRQAVAEGGSFHRSDLQRVARSVEAYLLLGLQAESGNRPEREPTVLAARPLHKISQSGARLVERLRQPALRMGPLEAVLSPEQRAIVRSLAAPRMTLGSDGGPRVALLPGGSLPEDADLPTAGAHLQSVGAWLQLAQALGFARTEAALQAAGGVERVQEELALAAVLYSRLELGLTEAADLPRFRARYLARGGPADLAQARAGLEQTVEAWAAPRRVDTPRILELLQEALNRLAARVEAEAAGS